MHLAFSHSLNKPFFFYPWETTDRVIGIIDAFLKMLIYTLNYLLKEKAPAKQGPLLILAHGVLQAEDVSGG